MNSEIGQTEITDRQLIPTGTTPRKSLSREIGEAEVVHTIFGRARVRIIRKEDGFRRNLWWAVVAVMVTVVAAQVWFIWQHEQETQVMESEPATSPDAASASAVPVTQPIADVPPLVAVPAVPAAPVAAPPAPVIAPPLAPVVVTRTLPKPPVAQAASAVPALPRRAERPQPAPAVERTPLSEQSGVATATAVQESKPEPPSDQPPR